MSHHVFNLRRQVVTAIAAACIAVVPALANDASADDAPAKAGKKDRVRNPANALIKQLEKASIELSDQTKEELMKVGRESGRQMAEVMKAKAITQEDMSKLNEARAAARKQGLKGPEIEKTAYEKSGLSADQIEGVKKITEHRRTMFTKVRELLSEEQLEKLPKRLKGQIVGGKGKGGKGKGKKKDDN